MTRDDTRPAGAPKLAPGLFYRVRFEAFGFLCAEVRQRRRFGSRCLGESLVFPAEFGSGEEAARFACLMAWGRMHLDERRYRLNREAARFLGDHGRG